MPVYLPEPARPDHGGNRLSLNAHVGRPRGQCGLLPTKYVTLYESMTGRQRWGGCGRCTMEGACSSCPVQREHLQGAELEWPRGTPVLRARSVPLQPDPEACLQRPGGRTRKAVPDTPVGC